MTKRMLIMLGGVLVLVLLLAGGFYLHIRKLIASSPRPGPQTVSAVEVRAVDWQPQVEAVGSLRAVRGVDVTTEIAGLVRTVAVQAGQDVAVGTVLVSLNADAEVAQLQALEAAADLADSVLARDRAQLALRAVSQAQFDADYADATGKRALAAEQAALVAKKTIRAPFGGKLGITTVNPGQYLNPGDKIATLQQLDPIYLDFYLPQREVARLSPGQSVDVTTDGFPGEIFAGRITAISPKVDPATRTVQVLATLPNHVRELLPGMFANVAVLVGAKQAYLTLPQTAITYNPYGSTVFILTKPSGAGGGLVAQQVFVTTGDTRGDQVAVLTGLKEGQLVVTSGQLKLKSGTPVVIDNSVQPADSAHPTPQER
jgi:membrane fusion protein, multidrug efflux system